MDKGSLRFPCSAVDPAGNVHRDNGGHVRHAQMKIVVRGQRHTGKQGGVDASPEAGAQQRVHIAVKGLIGAFPVKGQFLLRQLGQIQYFFFPQHQPQPAQIRLRVLGFRFPVQPYDGIPAPRFEQPGGGQTVPAVVACAAEEQRLFAAAVPVQRLFQFVHHGQGGVLHQ